MFLRTLGALSLEATSFRRQKPLLLLAYLTIQGPAPRGRLATLFWPDASDARDSLSTTVRRLNRLSPQLIIADGEFLSATVRCDALEFLHSDDDALYSGPFLHGLEVELQEEAEEWVWTLRERIADHARRIRLEVAAMDLAAGRLSAARHRAESCLDLDHAAALDTVAQLELLRILRSTGSSRLSAALRTRGRATREGTQQLSGNLPVPSDAFVGRSAELRQVLSLFGEGKARLVTIHGTGGSGKSRLAIEAAAHLWLSGELDHGAWFVPLETVPAEEGLASTIAQVLQLPAPVSAAMEAHVLRNLADRNLLLILDNFEHLSGGVGFVHKLLTDCPSVRIMVTSRLVLNLTLEHVVPLEGLPVETDAVQLLMARMAQRAAAKPDSPEALAAARQICALVGGQPLAIELAASMARFQSLAVLADGLADDYRLLVNRDPTVPERQRSIESTLDVSWQLLAEADRTALVRVSVFEAGFESAAAQQVGISVGSLERLVEAALLRCGADGRFRLHPLVREYARSQLEQRPELAERAQADHAVHYLNLLRLRAHESFGGPTTRAYHGLLGVEYPNILRAWEHAVNAGWWAELAEASLPLGMYFVTTADYADCVALLDRTIEALEAAPDAGSHRASLGRLLGVHAYPLSRLGQNHRALELSQRATELLEADPWGLWSARQAAAFAYMAVQDPGAALKQARANTLIELPDESEGSRCIWNIATGTSYQVAAYLHYLNGEYQEALSLLQVAEQRMREYRAPFYSFNYWTMGMILLSMERAAEARTWLEQGVGFAAEIGMRNQQGFLHLELGRAWLGQGEVKAALQNAEEALKFARLTSDAWLEQDAEALLGLILLESANPESALCHLRNSLTITTSFGLFSLGTAALIGVGKWLQSQGRTGEATELLAFAVSSDAVPVPARRNGREQLEALKLRSAAAEFEQCQAAGRRLSPAAAFALAAELVA